MCKPWLPWELFWGRLCLEGYLKVGLVGVRGEAGAVQSSGPVGRKQIP